ncbi:ATP-binding protein [Faecalicoccus pleomorphus]|uniref:ATP-binding protein n=1 Tax=Faecalicoccus pleomorphus TaxID=1323 RepID=UPI0019617E12|nr:ATP-binding protein [Faecalicoccus pleomorphus]MBM6765893.1 ATP-binding protein [Faecalicoccus pleomorphus]
MQDIFLTSYSVKGIKNLDQLIKLDFYKKTITKSLDTQEYNLKGIYGMNGSGKSAIVTSVKILKNLLSNSNYLNNPIIQQNLDSLINKKTKELLLSADFIVKMPDPIFFQYTIILTKNDIGTYVVHSEKFAMRKTLNSSLMNTVYETKKGEIVNIFQSEEIINDIEKLKEKTINLLEKSTLSVLFIEKVIVPYLRKKTKKYPEFLNILAIPFLLSSYIYVYLDHSDDHRDYLINSLLDKLQESEVFQKNTNSALDKNLKKDEYFDVLSVSKNRVLKTKYKTFEKNVSQLDTFLHIFKEGLKNIEIDKKEDGDFFVCDLIMVYDSYKVHAEYESTGIKKLIQLFEYLKKMVNGSIVFIDEFDSNLHDVYLCALLEYLMEYGKGQLCFTTHNVGPMDVLRQRKKSIDFLSEDHKVYSWRTNGNYSPAKLYRSGMIEGSPFNVDSIDFIGMFDDEEN